MDLFERQRTAIIGGQPSLCALQQEGVSVVVTQLRGLRMLRAPRLGSRMQVVSSESVSCGGLIYDVLQRIVAASAEGDDDDELAASDRLAECLVRMVFLRDGKMIQPPPHLGAVIDARREPPPEEPKEGFSEHGLPSPLSVTSPLDPEMPRMSLCDLYE